MKKIDVEKLPKVSIYGLLPRQVQQVKNKLKGKATFNFVDKNRIADAIPPNQDIILIWCDKVSHKITSQARKRSDDKTEVILYFGGLSKMVKRLEESLS